MLSADNPKAMTMRRDERPCESIGQTGRRMRWHMWWGPWRTMGGGGVGVGGSRQRQRRLRCNVGVWWPLVVADGGGDLGQEWPELIFPQESIRRSRLGSPLALCRA